MGDIERRPKLNHSLLADPNIEVLTKYFYLCLCLKMKTNPEVIHIDCFESHLGISRHKVYRARSQLMKRGAIMVTAYFCPDTGRKVSDIYKVK